MAILESGPLLPPPASPPPPPPTPSTHCDRDSSLLDDDDEDSVDDVYVSADKPLQKSLDDEEEEAGDQCAPQTSEKMLLNLRIKCNSTNLRVPTNCAAAGVGGEFPLRGIPTHSTVHELKAATLAALLGPTATSGSAAGGSGDAATRTAGTGSTNQDRYIRLIVRGRLLAPDAAPISNFGVGDEDVVHAVVAAEGVRGGQQATLARGVDFSGIGSGAGGRGDGTSSGGGGGGDAGAGVGVGRSRRGTGRSSTGRGGADRGPLRGVGVNASGIIVPPSNSRDDTSSDEEDEGDGDDLEAGRQRRGFDRLRATGLSRDEIAAIRIYFARQVDRFGERRERNRRRLEREREEEQRREQRQRQQADGGAGGEEGGNAATSTASGNDSNSNNNNNESSTSSSSAQDIRNDRLRLEDEWMAAQGPTSEFRLNLNANVAPLILGALRNGGAGGLAFRGGAAAGGGGTATTGGGGFAGSLGTGPDGMTAPWAAATARSSSLVGSDRDFVWGFILGFFVGFIMLFWVWMPTVPHKQKLGLLTGMCLHMALKMRSSGGDVDAFDEED